MLLVCIQDVGLGPDQDIKVKSLSIGQLRKQLANAGLSPMDTKNELILSLREHLLKLTPGSSGGINDDDGLEEGGGSGSNGDAELVADILQLSSEANYTGILSLTGTAIVDSSSKGAIRKAYHKLSLRVHPDKLGKKFPNANLAFHAVVAAYEHLCQPKMSSEAEAKANSQRNDFAQLDRSNQGCVRTTAKCPRCTSLLLHL